MKFYFIYKQSYIKICRRWLFPHLSSIPTSQNYNYSPKINLSHWISSNSSQQHRKTRQLNPRKKKQDIRRGNLPKSWGLVGKGPKQPRSREKKRAVERRRSSGEMQWRERDCEERMRVNGEGERERERETKRVWEIERKEVVQWNVPDGANETKGGSKVHRGPSSLFFFFFFF